MGIFENKGKLGFGLMRLPLLDKNDAGSIDLEQLKEMVDLFLSKGFTYFDTAIMYCGAKSQSAIKAALTDRYPRESFTIATKLHGDYFHSLADRDRVFQEQLETIGVTYFDYYLLHDIGAERYPKYVEFDCFNWLLDKREKGLVKHIGFSYHDNADLLDKVLTEHPEMEFVQLQLNYLDWDSEGIQSAKCYDVCVKHGKPVIVMEPVRGGTLANVQENVEEMFKAYHPDQSVASWAIRFAASHDQVKVVLSGMSNVEQMLDNTSYMEDFQPLNEEERAIVQKAVERIKDSLAIPCTECAYCTEGCPMRIAIPKYFSLYNADLIESEEKGWTPQKTYYKRLNAVFGKASACIGCGQCEKICPQHLPIIEHLKTVAEYFEGTDA